MDGTTPAEGKGVGALVSSEGLCVGLRLVFGMKIGNNDRVGRKEGEIKEPPGRKDPIIVNRAPYWSCKAPANVPSVIAALSAAA